MPQAKPTQVIVHRIELQQTERKQLEEFLEIQKNVNIANSVSKFVGPLATAGSIIGGVWIGAKVWAAVQAALLGPIENAAEDIGNLFVPITEEEKQNRTTVNKVRDWGVFDLTDLLQLAPEGSTARQAGDFGERATDWVWDTLFGAFEGSTDEPTVGNPNDGRASFRMPEKAR